MNDKAPSSVSEVIILAGGQGTRLQSVTGGLPKCLVPIGETPFLHILITLLQQQRITHFVFALGHAHEVITRYLQEHFPDLSISISVEATPLGTGGALRKAIGMAHTPNVAVVNGDTLFTGDIASLAQWHWSQSAIVTIALKTMYQVDRYGSIATDAASRILSFDEKKYYPKANINCGLYIINCPAFLADTPEHPFSLESEYLEPYADAKAFYGLVQEGYFMDIGIPEDWHRFTTDWQHSQNTQRESTSTYLQIADQLSHSSYNRALPFTIDKSWTLFLDRDGVINEEKHQDYIHTWEEFRFYPGVIEAMAVFARLFGRIIIVTNQKGVGKGYTLKEDLERIHENMTAVIREAGGHIDRIYYCPDLENDSPDRKPNPGMGLRARQDFPDIDFTKSIMVGNTLSDMQFARNLGVYSIFLPTTRPEVHWNNSSIDRVYDNLPAFASSLLY